MKYEFEKVIDGMSKYINDEIYSSMNDLQEFAARVIVGRIINNQENVKEMLINNGFVRTFGVIDAEGMVDVDSIAGDIKREIARKEKITFKKQQEKCYMFLWLFLQILLKRADLFVIINTYVKKEKYLWKTTLRL